MEKLADWEKADCLRFWRNVVYDMGGGWVLDETAMARYMPPGETVWSFEAVLVNGTFTIHARNRVYGIKGKWHCFPVFPADSTGVVNTPYGAKCSPHSVNIAEGKNSKQLATELLRRAVKDWQEYANKVIFLNTKFDAERASAMASMRRLASTFNLKSDQDFKNNSSPTLWLDARWSTVHHVTVRQSGKFDLNIHNATEEQVDKVLAALQKPAKVCGGHYPCFNPCSRESLCKMEEA